MVTAEMLEQLTQPFVRREASAGSGLGLAVVEQMVAAMNGTLAITARPAGGLSVVLRLPHHQDEQQEENTDERDS
ncbi:MAG: ATP-binding protein [Thermomicrobiales bacterium]|nr:ATP-binding protein [Thermomicrobiales bacterium]